MENPINCFKCSYMDLDSKLCKADNSSVCVAVQAAHCEKLREYLDTGLSPSQVTLLKLSTLLNGYNFLYFPCQVGDTVYVVKNGKIFKSKILKISVDIGEKSSSIECYVEIDGYVFLMVYGKTVFPTYEKAKRELEKENSEDRFEDEFEEKEGK
jgi:hypothetical protein